MAQTAKTYKSLEEIYKFYLPSSSQVQKQDHNDPETIWEKVEKEVRTKLKRDAQYGGK